MLIHLANRKTLEGHVVVREDGAILSLDHADKKQILRLIGGVAPLIDGHP